MSDLGDATNWTDREREFFAAGWNECLKMQPGENGKLRAALLRCRGMVGHPDNIAFIDAALGDQQTGTDSK